MAAEVGQRFSGWSYSDLPYNDHGTQEASVQQMVLDHGSVSFGRFAAEALSWEKRSVFAHNSRQEELSKLTAPGLVAQKKAFFEEYYKRARHLKALGKTHQTEATSEERSDGCTMDSSSLVDKSTTVLFDDPVAGAPSSRVKPSTEVSSSDESKCQDPNELGYLTFNPLFSHTAGLQNLQQEEMSSSGHNEYIDEKFPCTARTSRNDGLNSQVVERKVLAQIVSDDNAGCNAGGSRIVQGAQKKITLSRPAKRSQDLSTSVIHIPKLDLRRPSQDLKDPFHKRVEMKLRALSDRMNAYRAATSSRSASYQPPCKATTSSGSSHQNADRRATSSRSSLCLYSSRVLAPSKSATQASHQSDNLPHGIFFKKGSRASSNSISSGKLSAKILLMPSSSQVNAKTSRSAQVTLKSTAGFSVVNNESKNKRKQLSTPATSDENNLKRGYMRISAPTSARSSSDNLPPTAKAPKFSNRKNQTKAEVAQKSASASHPIGGGINFTTKRTVKCNEQNTKVTSSRAGSLGGSSLRSYVTSQNQKQERPRWR